MFFDKDDMVLLSTRNLRLPQPCRKFSSKRVGPFQITKKINSHAYRLAPPDVMSRIRDIFHVSLLEPYRHRAGTAMVPEFDAIVDDDEWEVEKILGYREDEEKALYQVQWKAWSTHYANYF